MRAPLKAAQTRAAHYGTVHEGENFETLRTTFRETQTKKWALSPKKNVFRCRSFWRGWRKELECIDRAYAIMFPFLWRRRPVSPGFPVLKGYEELDFAVGADRELFAGKYRPDTAGGRELSVHGV
jgi:hypothetical protein